MKSIDKFKKIEHKWKLDEKKITKTFSEDIYEIKKLHKLKIMDKWNNLFHLSSYSGLINDPNGLMKHKNKFHIFYQWSPFVPINTVKHWGHFETKDFINYIHTGLAIEPKLKEEKNGVFSGGGISYKGIPYVFWTGNVKKFNSLDKNRTSYTLIGQWCNKQKKVIKKKNLFKVNKNIYTGHFRDPKPFIKNNKFYLLHGAQTKKLQGALSLYSSNNINSNYNLLGNIKIKPSLGDFGFMWECPNYFVINGKEFLVFSPQGKSFFKPKNENKDNVIIVFGKMDFKNLIFKRTNDYQIIDEGFDFYAPQIFSNTRRTIIIGWAGVGKASSYATFKHMWAHNLTLARELKINKNNKIIQLPLNEYKKLRKEKSVLSKIIDLSNSRLFEFSVSFTNKFEFKLINLKKEYIKFNFDNFIFKANRENMSFDQAPNLGRTRTRKHYNLFNNVTVYIDNSLIEIYANNGEFVFTSKYWLDDDIKLVSSIDIKKGYKLKPFNIKWNL